MKSISVPWTRRLFNEACPCGSGSKSYECCWAGDGRWEKTPVAATPLPVTSVPPFINERCYLSSYGDCGTKITKEHFISRTVLERVTTDKLTIENAGHIFGGKNKVEIGVDSFAAKVLCDVHNPSLSALDTAIGIAFANMDALAKNMEKTADASKHIRSFHISSGLDIERWMIKVYCGLVAAGAIRSSSEKVVGRDAVTSILLDALVGKSSLPTPLGLYHHAFTGQTRSLGRVVSIGTIRLTDGSDDVGGLLLTLGPINFVLITSMEFGRTFKEPNWYRHPTILINLKQGNARIAYFLTY
jgi:hypothetical protein